MGTMPSTFRKRKTLDYMPYRNGLSSCRRQQAWNVPTADARKARKRAFRRSTSSVGDRSAAPAHHVEEVQVRLAGLHLVEHELHRLDLVHRVEQLAQDPRLLQDLRLQQHLFAAGAAAIDLDGGVDALLGHAAIQV